jgi:hypothetical protein
MNAQAVGFANFYVPFSPLSFSLEMVRECPMSMKQYARVVAPAMLPALQEPSPCNTSPTSKF